MAGHSKWANIKHRKARQDAKRAKIWTKLIREIVTAAKHGGGDIDANPRLRLAVDKALAENMTRDTIDRAIKRGSGDKDGENYDEITYEGYGPGGVAVMVECLTDNRNRTVAEVRHAFTKHGGNLGTDGSVAYLFSKMGLIRFAKGSDEEKILEIALESGADDIVNNEDGSIEVQTSPEAYQAVKDALDAADLKPELAEITMVASNEIPVDKETAETLLKMLDILEDLDDVQEVYSNADIPEELMEGL